MRHGGYEPLPEDNQGRLISRRLNLALVRWQGTYQDVEAQWLRWATLDGTLLPTPQEVAAEAQRQAATLEAQLARYRERFGELP